MAQKDRRARAAWTLRFSGGVQRRQLQPVVRRCSHRPCVCAQGDTRHHGRSRPFVRSRSLQALGGPRRSWATGSSCLRRREVRSQSRAILPHRCCPEYPVGPQLSQRSCQSGPSGEGPAPGRSGPPLEPRDRLEKRVSPSKPPQEVFARLAQMRERQDLKVWSLLEVFAQEEFAGPSPLLRGSRQWLEADPSHAFRFGRDIGPVKPVHDPFAAVARTPHL